MFSGWPIDKAASSAVCSTGLWTFSRIERWLRSVWILTVSEDLYFPGIVFVSFILLVLTIGYSSLHTLLHKAWRAPGLLIARTPVIKFIYSIIKNFLHLMGGESFSDQSVVWVRVAQNSSRLPGVVTHAGGAMETRS